MIDFRLKTFFTLSQILNYTKTAELLHITQPAVSQHVKYLEDKYNVKLFEYKGKLLSLTTEGKILFDFVAGIEASSHKVKELLSSTDMHNLKIHFGTTLTIGQYTMPNILSKLIKKFPQIKFSMDVDNTHSLLEKLKNGKIDFALLEGHFNKSDYDTILFSKEEFIGVCSPMNPLSKKKISFEEMLNESLIVREEGSGSREIFEQILYENNFTMDSFKQIYEIGNISVIKNLVLNNLGVTFLYEKAVEKELNDRSLCKIDIVDFNVKREYNFVFLKYNLHSQEYITWFNHFFKD